MGTQPSWKARWALGAVALLLSLGMAELAFRLFWLHQLTIGQGIEHPHFHHRLLPNTTYHFATAEFNVDIRTNRYGLRGPDPVIPKPAGVTRLLMLGDSFTFGFPVRDDQTFSHVIESGLRARGRQVEVINGGVSGYAPTLHYISLRDQFLAFEPDAVILWYDLGDLQEDHWFEKNLIRDAQGRVVAAHPHYRDGRFDWWSWLVSRSALAKWVNNKPVSTYRKLRVLGFRRYLKVIVSGERAKVAIAKLKASQHAADLGMHDRFLLVREGADPASVRAAWKVSERYLLMIRDLLRERGISFALGIYPYGMLAGPDEWAHGRVFWGFEPGRTYDASGAQSLLHEFCQRERIPLIDTFQAFQTAAATQQEKLFYDEDGHMTPAGHRVLAKQALADHQLVAMMSRGRAHARR